VEIQKSAMSTSPGAGMAGGVWMQTNGCGCAPILVDQAIATPGNAAKLETKYCTRSALRIDVPAIRQSASA
jgi:hypothetical protein